MSTAPVLEDAIFFDAQMALEQARKAQRVPVWGHCDGTQICYYTADAPLEERLDNLVHLSPERMIETLVFTRMRLPQAIVTPERMPQEMRESFVQSINTIMDEVRRLRQLLANQLGAEVAQLKRAPIAGRPLRVLAVANRHTTVMQYASRGVIDAFRALGHEARLVIEADDREMLATCHIIQEMLSFAPDIVVNVNHHYASNCMPGSIQVVWWQDPMPALRDHEQIPWRREDMAYILDGFLREGVIGTGLAPERIRTQHFCIDDGIFQPPSDDSARRRAVVFVGSSYRNAVDAGNPGEAELISCIDAALDAGFRLDTAHLLDLAARCGVDAEQATCRTMVYCVRDRFVRRLCRQRELPVEIYGFGWDQDPEVAAFYRGPVQHGKPLADLYRGVSHALSLHPLFVNHQRLAEIGACGCVPVAWDCRATSEPPHWDEEVRFFRDEAGLQQALTRPARTYPQRFRSHFSYRRFAQRIIDDARADGLLPAQAAALASGVA